MRNPQKIAGLTACALAILCTSVGAQDLVQLKKSLSENLQGNTTIEEVSKTEIPGIYEVRVNDVEFFYTNESGRFLLTGKLIDMKSKRNLTDEKIDKITAIKFRDLPASDSITYTRGDGSRKVAIFADPNCGYCKRFETELLKVDNITVSVYVLPILGVDSTAKAKAVWCAPEKNKVWLEYMTKEKAIPMTTPACDTEAITRNLSFARRHAIRGTPAVYFQNDRKVGGYIDAKQVEAILAEAEKKS